MAAWPQIFGYEFSSAYDVDPQNILGLDGDTRAEFLDDCRHHLLQEANTALAPYGAELSPYGDLDLGTLAGRDDMREVLSDLFGDIDHTAIIDRYIAD